MVTLETPGLAPGPLVGSVGTCEVAVLREGQLLVPVCPVEPPSQSLVTLCCRG